MIPALKRIGLPVLDTLEEGLSSLEKSLQRLRSSYTPPPDRSYEPPKCPEGMQTGPPDFVGLGAQKSGTTWWYKLIGQYEDVFVPSFEENVCPPYFYKEGHFFDSYYNTGFDGDDVEAYHKWFPRPPGMVTGEWTPRYLVDPSAPALLAKAVPDAKFLVLLRDPVSRFESGMAQTQRGTELRPDKALIHYTRGLYARQLKNWLNEFPRESFLILQFEKCVEDSATEIQRTFRFLGLEETQLPNHLFGTKVNKRQSRTKYAIPSHLRDALVRQYTADLRQLKELVPSLDLGLWPNFSNLA